VFLRFTNHEHHNHDALLAATGFPAALFLVEEEKKRHGIFLYLESLSFSALMQSIWVKSASLYRPETEEPK